MLSAGNCHDAPIGRELLAETRPEVDGLLMDKAYEEDETRRIAARDGRAVVVPPKSNRKNPWEYDKILYKKRNEVERMSGTINENRRIATRYDKLACVYLSFVYLAFLKNALRQLALTHPNLEDFAEEAEGYVDFTPLNPYGRTQRFGDRGGHDV